MENNISRIIDRLYELGRFSPQLDTYGNIFIPDGEEVLDELGLNPNRVYAVNALVRKNIPREMSGVVGVCKEKGRLITDPIKRKTKLAEWVNYMQTRKAEEGIAALKGINKSSDDLIEWGLRPHNTIDNLYIQGFSIVKIGGATYAGFGIPIETYSPICEVPVFDDEGEFLYTQTAVNNSFEILDPSKIDFQYAYIPTCSEDHTNTANLNIQFDLRDRNRFLTLNNLDPIVNINFTEATGQIIFEQQEIVEILDRAVRIYDNSEDKIAYEVIAQEYGMSSGFNFKVFKDYLRQIFAKTNISFGSMMPVYKS